MRCTVSKILKKKKERERNEVKGISRKIKINNFYSSPIMRVLKHEGKMKGT